MQHARLAAAVSAVVLAVSLAVAVPTAADAVTDTTAPTIGSVKAAETSVRAGDPIALRFTAHDDLAGVTDVNGTMTGPGGVTLDLLPAGGDWPWVVTSGGPIAGVVPEGAAPGTYTLTRLTVYDAAGNYTDYTQASAESQPAGSAPLIDLGAVRVTVTQPGTTDVIAPKLSAFAMDSSTNRRRGEFVTWSYALLADASPISEVKVFVRTPSSATNETHRGGGDLRKGRISFWLPTDAETGTWTVTGVQLTDTAGNIRTYGPNGKGLQTGHVTHSGPSFTGMTFTVGTGAIRPDSIRVFDTRPDAVVKAKVPSTPVAVGSSAVVSGTATFLGRPMPFPVVAVYRAVGSKHTFLRLVHGTAAGTFATRVNVSGTARYAVWFLGSDRAVGPVPNLVAKDVLLRAGVRQTLTVASTSVTVPSGRSGTLSVALSPQRSGVTLVLRRWNGSAWVAARSVTTRADGKAFTTVSRPATTAKYRWTTAYDGKGLAATSSVVTVRR